MQFRPRLTIWLNRTIRDRRGIRRRLVGIALLAAFVVTAVGVPLPRASGGKDRSQPFPCADRPCGCRNAEQCWRGCCCFSMQEKVAWAEKNGVRPPAFVLAAAKRESKSADVRGHVPCAHCKLAKKSPASASAAGKRQDGFSKSKSDISRADTVMPGGVALAQTAQKTPVKNPPRRSVAVIGSLSLHCQGIALLWSTVAGSAPEKPGALWMFDWLMVSRVVCGDERLVSAETDPPIPPPRQASTLG